MNKKMPMYMYGGKVYAEKGAMLKAILKDPDQAKVARKVLGSMENGGKVKRTATTEGGVRTSSARRKKSLRYTEMDTDPKRAPLGRGVKTRQTGFNENDVARRSVVKSVDGTTGEVRKRVFMRDDTRRGKKSQTGQVKDKSRFVSRKKANKKLARILAKQDRMDKRARK